MTWWEELCSETEAHIWPRSLWESPGTSLGLIPSPADVDEVITRSSWGHCESGGCATHRTLALSSLTLVPWRNMRQEDAA